MELRLRNLFPYYLSKCPEIVCSDDNSSSSSSSSSCPCVYPPPPLNVEHSKTHIKTYLIITFSTVSFILLCCYFLYAKFICPRRSRTTTTSQPQTQEDRFLDEEQQHGPVVDHPIWYIRTIGLQQSIIGAITVCKYKKGEGLIEGTECSVCLSEFQEAESLRLLPKCNHAFHLPCIDTWLRSHTNCPMCRAPIVIDPTRVPSMDPNAFGSRNSFVEMENLEIRVEDAQNSSNDNVSRSSEEQQGVEESENLRSVVTVQPRRSVSLDSSSANKISLALATVMSGESHGNNNSKRVDGHGNLASKDGSSSSSSRTRHLHSEPSSMKRSRSFNAKHLLSWYNSRSQRKPNAPLRSF